MGKMGNMLRPEPPFLWPEPRILDQICSYEQDPPFEAVARASDSVFGIVSSLSGGGIDLLKSWLKDKNEFQARLIIAVYPACLTHQDDLTRLLGVTERYPKQLTARIRPYRSASDRPTNTLCFLEQRSGVVYMVTGQMENLGFDPWPEGKLGFVFRADATLVESFSRYFNWLWANSQDLSARGVTQIPNLVIPEGSAEAAQRWGEYFNTCLKSPSDGEMPGKDIQINLETGGVDGVSVDGRATPLITDEIGIPRLDSLAESIARLYEKGSLVSIDKLSRIPPLDAPLDPSWFGDASEIQRGNVTRRVSMRISIIDEKTLKEIDKRRQALRVLLNRFTFGLSDNMRWMPHQARALFESELERVNEEGQKLVSDLLKGDVAGFIKQKLKILVSDINAMYKELGSQGVVTEEVVTRVTNSLQERLTKAQSANFMPKLTYSGVTFNVIDNTWASPWGQAYSLLSDIAIFPRKALTDPFFLRGIKVPEDNLIEAMNVADDDLFRSETAHGTKDRCKKELAILTRIDGASIDSHKKCDLVWRILGGEKVDIAKDLDEKGKA